MSTLAGNSLMFLMFRVCSGYPEQLNALIGQVFSPLFRVFRHTHAPVRAHMRPRVHTRACVCAHDLFYPEHPEQRKKTE